MGYYIRVLGKSDVSIPISTLEHRLETEGIGAKFEITKGDNESWTEVEMLHTDPTAPPDGIIALIERNTVSPGSLAKDELDEFSEEVEECKPESATKWLKKFFPQVKVIYCFQIIHHGAEWGNGWQAIHTIDEEIWKTLGGIFQADGEGFSNEDGYHILWQFSENVKGSWQMAVLDTDNRWIPFEMDLGNKKQREAFLEGKVPPGAKRL